MGRRSLNGVSDESIVLQLQRDALNREVPVSDLLRKALLVATKLGVHDLEEWINHELNGYPDSRTFPFPPYRQLEGQLVAYNPVQRRWMPVVSNDPRFIEGLSIRPSNQRVAELEHVLAADTDGVLRMLSPA